MNNALNAGRRSFLKKTIVGSAGLAVTGGMVQSVFGKTAAAVAPGAGNKWPGRVVINFNKGAASFSASGVGTTVTSVVKTMVDDSIKRLTDKTTVGEAWKAVFPATLAATSTIAIKVPLDFANQTVAPHWALVKAITDGLQLMDFNGTKFPAANITIFDMRGTNNLPTFGYTATNIPNVHIVSDSMGSGYTDGAIRQGTMTHLQYATSLRKDFLINVFRAGGHSGYVEGLTLGFKNHYGTYDVDHGSSTAPGYLRDINCTGAVYNKNVLSICAGIFGAAEASGSPGSAAITYYTYAHGIDPTVTGPNFPANTIIMSTDPVSAEMQCIKMMRLNNGKSFTVANLPKYLRASGGDTTALTDATYNIGVIDETAMDIRRITNATTIISSHEHSSQRKSSGASIIATPTGAQSTFIEFSLPESHLNGNASIGIYDLKGTRIARLSQKVLGAMNHVSWDNRDGAGAPVGKGTYVVRLVSDNISIASNFLINR
jgi:hypothetical protein